MPIEWSGLAPELLLTLDRRSADPLHSQLEGRLREAIRSGRLRTGERLPSSRELARELGLSRGLVQDCYAQLQAEGYLESRVGSATRVAAGAGDPAAGSVPAVTRHPARQALKVDFRSGVPDLASFPRGDWVWALREACRAAPNAAFDYGDPSGSPVLREVLAAYMRGRGGPGTGGHLHRVRAGAEPGVARPGPQRGPPGGPRGPGIRGHGPGDRRPDGSGGHPRSCRRVGHRRVRARQDPRPRRRPHARPPVAHRGGAGPPAAPGTGRVGGQPRRHDHRRRLRRRVPLRPRAGGCPPGPRGGPGGRARDRQQVPGASCAARVDSLPARAGRGDHRGEGAE